LRAEKSGAAKQQPTAPVRQAKKQPGARGAERCGKFIIRAKNGTSCAVGTKDSKMTRITFLFVLMVSITNASDYDLSFMITKKNIVIKEHTDSNYISIENIESLKDLLESKTKQFEEDVRCGRRKQVYSLISVSINEDLDYQTALALLHMINGYCYQVLKKVEIMGKEINVISEIHPGNYPCWKNSSILYVGKGISKRQKNIECSVGMIRIYATPNQKISTVMNDISKKTNINKEIYQFCSDEICYGMNGYYGQENANKNLMNED